jgi:hypothetical protein
MKGEVIHAYLDCNVVDIEEQLTGIVTRNQRNVRKEHIRGRLYTPH